MTGSVLLDTNVLLSYLLAPQRKGPISEIVTAGILGKYKLLVPQQLLAELINKTCSKKYLVKKIKPQEAERLIALLKKSATLLPEITEAIPLVARDPKDDYLLAAALLGQADYLVTGDKDLLELKKVRNLQILSPKDFAKKLKISSFSTAS